ncbi:MAG: hypothetical protein L0Y80_07970 [Ignavibacteriae bacterium]|nr:hypothetical protein [Ignavibacteriota bacterium]
MKRSTFLVISAVLGMFVGLMQMLATEDMLSSFGMTPDAAGILIVRLFGAITFSVGLMNWVARNADDSVALRAILYGNLAIHFLQLVIDIMGITAGTLASTSWGSVAIHALLGFGFAYFAFTKPKEA